jgi:hypothetical protein
MKKLVVLFCCALASFAIVGCGESTTTPSPAPVQPEPEKVAAPTDGAATPAAEGTTDAAAPTPENK